MADPILLLTDEAMLGHDAGSGHPERPDRLRAIRAGIERGGLPSARWSTAAPAAPELISRVHAPAYVAGIASLRGQARVLDPDTATSPGSVDAAFLAAGAAVAAVEEVASGRTSRAWALVRPPGHHAESDRAMGFCFFNNVAIAAAHARTLPGIDRVLVVDWDVHHGNGTQHMFERRPDVLVFNTHRFPFYPGTGAATEVGRDDGKGFTVNVPLPGGLGDGDYAEVYRELLEPVAEQFRPDLVIVSAGFDAHRDDPLADMEVTEEGFAGLCAVVRNIADRFAGGRLALVLEGGYDLTALTASVRACLEVLSGSAPPAARKASSRGTAALREAMRIQRAHWHLS
jgi:acetoin utilization deacetylase AcuC-like enzyme